MRKTLTSLLAGAALATIAGAAGAQTYGGYYPPYPGGDYGYGGYNGGYGGYGGYGQTATLYELPGFQGRSVVVNGSNGNLADIGFNDRARSVRLTGTWKLCEDAGFHSRCETMSGNIPDLRVRGISGLSSLQPTNDYPGYPGGYPGGYGNGVQGRSVVFYPGPVSSSYGSGYGSGYGPPWGNGYGYGISRRAADDFCRSMGSREAIYYDSAGGQLQDVLCRR